MTDWKDLFTDPAEEDLHIIRTKTLAALQFHPASKRRLWLWFAPAAAVLLCLVWFVPPRAANRITKPEPVPVEQQQLASLPISKLPEHQLLPRLRPVHHNRPRRSQIGLQTAEWITSADGSAQIRMQTADPNVIILLPMNRGREEN